ALSTPARTAYRRPPSRKPHPNPNNRRHIPEGTRRRLFLEVPVTPLITESDCSGPHNVGAPF
ncbi:hypothetical protein, partial [Corynebacterium durum]|uniref:hypothetical protein n=1 Tax=Corynebacterium durum TaxID=61592 RepID=UPI0028E7C547